MVQQIADLETPPNSQQPLLKATVTQPATLSTSPVSPVPLRNLGLGVVLGLLLGLGLAVLRETLDTTVKSGEVAAEVAGAPVVGAIQFDPGTSERPLITSLDSHAPRNEAFRVLRTNMSFIDVDATDKVIAVSSSLPGEGKSTTAVNLAISLAQAGQRVLLVDGDLRRPQVATMLGLEPQVGLTTVLTGRIQIDDAVQGWEVDGLDVLTSGSLPPNPAELLQSATMHNLVREVRDLYDVVVIDSPPLLPVTDAALITSLADGAVLVVRHGKTNRDQVAGARSRLENVGGRMLGVVLNMTPSGGRGGRYGYGYGYGYGYAPTGKTPMDDEPRVNPKRERTADAAPAAETSSAGRGEAQTISVLEDR